MNGKGSETRDHRLLRRPLGLPVVELAVVSIIVIGVLIGVVLRIMSQIM
jgi:hypothetical protein